MTENNRAVIYCRCSTEEESQVDALQKQVQEARTAVLENGWLPTDEYVESRSGTTAEGRGEYLRLLSDMNSEKFDIIVIKSQDRLMRNVKDWYLFLDRMLKNGKRLYVYLERKFYTTDDGLITGIKAILAEEYSRELSKKINNAHRNRQKNGGKIMLTNKVYGFKKLPDGSVEKVEEEAEVIQQIYAYCAAGYGCRTISNFLKEAGIRSKNEKSMESATIRRIIRNPLYKGTMVLNRRHFDFETKKEIHNPPEEWIYLQNAVPAIVDEELWEKANDAMNIRSSKSGRDGKHIKGSNPGKYNLSRVLVCGCCGKPYYRAWRREYKKPENVIYEWKCSSYIQVGRKQNGRREMIRKGGRNIATEEGCDNVHLEETTIYQLLEQLSNTYYQLQQEEKEGVIQKIIQLLEKVLTQNSSEKKYRGLEKEKEGLLQKKQVLLGKLLSAVISDGDYQHMNCQIEEKINIIENQLSTLQIQAEERASVAERLKTIKERLEHGGIERATVGQMLKDTECIVVHEWQLEVRFNPLHIAGISNLTRSSITQMLGEKDHHISIFIDYPFGPNTEKGRCLDRRRIWELLKESPDLTAKKLQQLMNRSRGIIVTRMGELRSGGYVQYVGKGGHGHWQTLKEYPDYRKLNVDIE